MVLWGLGKKWRIQMALDANKMVQAIANGQRVNYYKASMANMAAGYICSLWRAAGTALWQQGAIPGAAANPTDNTLGGIPLPDFGTNTARIYRFAAFGSAPATWMLYDRIGHMGGLSGTVLTAQTVNLAVETPLAEGRALANYSNIDWFVEIYTDLGTTASNLTVSYTDSANTSGKTITITGFTGTSPLNRAGRCVPLNPTDALPIKSVQSVTLSASSGTAGSFGITARVKLAQVGQLLANVQPPSVDAVSIGMPIIKSTSCIEMLCICSTTSTGAPMGELIYGSIAE